MGQKMKNAPVYFVLMQVQYNPYLALDSYVATIQDRLRTHGFPDVQKAVINTFNLNIGSSIESPQPQVPVSQITHYQFIDIKRESSFTLAQNSLTYQTTQYDTFDTFSKTYLEVLTMINEVLNFGYVDRIGLRYLDAIKPNIGKSVSKYLAESMSGLFEKVDGSVSHSFSETVFKNENVNITARAILQNGPLGVPPDLIQQTLIFQEKFTSINGKHAVLDIDGSIVERSGTFDLTEIKNQMKEIHSQIDKTFKVMITQEALNEWA
jgi:uncharacterized protein (TIGR04255 family)